MENRSDNLIDKYVNYMSPRAEWINKKDIYITLRLIDLLNAEFELAPPLLQDFLIAEIGVWKGAWSETILRNTENTKVTGVDPYPGGRVPQQAYETTVRCLADLINTNRFQLLESYASLNLEFSIIHIDGRHTEFNALKDLDFAKHHILEHGVIIVDDYRNYNFPGVASAMYKFIHGSNFRIFLVTEDKAYICEKSMHSFFQKYISDILSDDTILSFKPYYSDELSEEAGYIQEADVNGHSVFLC